MFYLYDSLYLSCFVIIKNREEEARLTTRMNLRNNERSTRFTLSSTNVLERCRCSTAGEIERLRALQNDLHYNRLCIRERRNMRSKRHYLCMRRNYNNCTIMYVCAADRCCKTRADVQNAYTHAYTHTHTTYAHPCSLK